MLEVNGKRIYLTHYPKIGASIASYLDGEFMQVGVSITNEKPNEPICPHCGQKIRAHGKRDQFSRKLGREIALGRLMSPKSGLTGRYVIPKSEVYEGDKFHWKNLVHALIKDIRHADVQHGEVGYDTADPFLARLKFGSDWLKLE